MLAVVLAAGGGYYVFTQRQAQAVAESKPNIRTAVIDRGTLTLTVSANGSIAAKRRANLSFDAPGVITAVAVVEGQQVMAGALLAEQDNTLQQLALEQAKTALTIAQLNLQRLTAPVDPRDVALAESQVKAAEGTLRALYAPYGSAALRSAQAQYTQSLAALEAATQRRKDVGGQSGPDSNAFQLALAQEGQASFGAEIARLQVEIVKRGPDTRLVAAAKTQVDAAQARVAQLKAGAPNAQVEQAQLAIEQAKTNVAQAERQLKATQLYAPFGGTVTALNLQRGSLSVNGVPAITLVDTSQLYIELRVDEVDVAQLSENQTVRLTLDALPGVNVTGKIEFIALIASQAAAVTNYPVKIVIDPTTAPIRVGMSASATITVNEVTGVVRVPNAFVRIDRRANQAYVNLVTAAGTLAEVPVNLGVRTDEYSEVLAGLVEGDVIGISLDSNFSLF